MLFFQEDGASAGAPAWAGDVVPWLLALSVLVALAAAAGVWVLVLRLRALERGGGWQEELEAIRARVDKLASGSEALDLRRIEHVLVDVRDAQLRLEEAILRSIETARAADPGRALVPAGDARLGERVVDRLLALGYERVQIVTRAEKLTELAAKDGEVLVEARRQGVLHKGRVVVRGGRIADVEIHPAYSIFP